MIYISLFTVAFMVATIVPFGSEATLLLYYQYKYNDLLLIIAASLGNVLGSVFNWVCGYYVNYFIKTWFPLNNNMIDRGNNMFKVWKVVPLLSWVPLL